MGKGRGRWVGFDVGVDCSDFSISLKLFKAGFEEVLKLAVCWGTIASA